MAEIDLKDIKSIEYNGERVDFISINGLLVWPSIMKNPQIQDVRLQTNALYSKSFIYEIYNDNDFDVECQCGTVNGLLDPTIIWEKSINIGSKSSGTIVLALNQGLYHKAFRFLCANTYFSDTIQNISFVAKINYEVDSDGIVLNNPIEYVLPSKEEEFVLQASVANGIKITKWELSEGLQEISHTSNSLSFKVLNQGSKSDLYIKITSEGESVCGTTCTTSASSSICGTICTISSSSSICLTPCTTNTSKKPCTSITSNSAVCLSPCTSNTSLVCPLCTSSSMGLNSDGSEADEINDTDIDEIYDI